MKLSNNTKNKALQLDILTILLEAPNCRLQSNEIWKKIMETLKEKYIPKLYKDESNLDTNFSRAKYALCTERLLFQEKLSDGVFYLIPEEIRAPLRIELQKIRNGEVFTKLDVDQQQRLLKEVEYYKAKSDIHELRQILFPRALIFSKMAELGLDPKEFNLKKCSGCVVTSCENCIVENMDSEVFGGIEFFLTEASFQPTEPDRSELNLSMFGWRIIGVSSITGRRLYGRYKNLGEMCEEQFERELLIWKDDFGKSDEEWVVLAPQLRKDPPGLIFKKMMSLPPVEFIIEEGHKEEGT